MSRGALYLLHFNRKLHHAAHYIGWSRTSVEARFEAHRNGAGARITAVLVERGITFELARVWRNKSRSDERRFKQQHNARRFCPLCSTKPRNFRKQKK